MDPSVNIVSSVPGGTPAAGAAGNAASSGAAGTGAAGSTAALGAGFAALLAALGLDVDPAAAALDGGLGTVPGDESATESLSGGLTEGELSTADAEALAAALAATAAAVAQDPPPPLAPTADASNPAAVVAGAVAGENPAATQASQVSPPAVAEAAPPPPAVDEPIAAPAVAGPAPAVVPTPTAEVATAAPSDQPLPSARVSSLSKSTASAASKTGGNEDAPAGVATEAAERSAPKVAQAETAGEFGADQQGDGEFHHAEVTQTVANRDTTLGRTVENASPTHPALTAKDLPSVSAAAPTPLRDVEEFVRLASLRGATPLREGSEVRLQVSPEGMGNVEVRLTVQHDGVHANLVTDQDQSRQVLQANRAALESALGRSNLRLEGFTVDLGFQQQQQQQHGGRQQPTPAQVFSDWFGPEHGVPAADGVAATTPKTASSGALSVHA